MCKWCDNPKTNKNFIDIESGLTVGIEENMLYAYTDSYFEEIEINFCPFCGGTIKEKE